MWRVQLLSSPARFMRTFTARDGLPLPREVRSRGCKSDIATLNVTPCSNLTKTNPVPAGRSTTAGSQIESHTHTVEPCRIRILPALSGCSFRGVPANRERPAANAPAHLRNVYWRYAGCRAS